MTTLYEAAFAKLNLTLDVLGKREDGYHDLQSVMQSISIRDDVEIDVGTGKPWKLLCTDESIPTDEKNLAWKAAKVFCDTLKKDPDGLEIRINKRIPSGAGLGGGSADAAAVDAVNALEETESGIEAAEALRVAAEELRAAAETARAEAESGRAEAEQQRQDAETQRQDLESGYVARSENGAKASESWAVGGTGTREGEDTNNAKYWSEQAAAAAGGGVTSFKGRTGSVIPASGDYTAEMVGAYSKEETDTLLQNKQDASTAINTGNISQ